MPPNAMVHNIVLGRTWVDVFGPMNITCNSGAKCVLEFTPCGWFSYGRYEFAGYVMDAGEWGGPFGVLGWMVDGRVCHMLGTRHWRCGLIGGRL